MLNNLDLDQFEISQIIEYMIGGSVNPELVEALTNESQGNPLFVIECLRMLIKDRSLFQDQGQWSLSIDTLCVPKRIKEIILQRLNVLNPNQRRILDVASLIGEKFDIGLLAAILRQDSSDVSEMLNVIAQSTALVSYEEDSFKFVYAKYHEVLYEEIPLALKKSYNARIAKNLHMITKRFFAAMEKNQKNNKQDDDLLLKGKKFHSNFR